MGLFGAGHIAIISLFYSRQCPGVVYNCLMTSIFITIPSYEDPLLKETIDSAINNADSPELLRFAVALMYESQPIPDLSCYYDDPRFSFTTYDVATRPGVNRIRHALEKEYSSEDFYLITDSHMEFAPSWDTLLVKEYTQIAQDTGNAKIVISKPVTSIVGDLDGTEALNQLPVWDVEEDLYSQLLSSPSYSAHGGWGASIHAWPKEVNFTDRSYFYTGWANFHFLFAPGIFAKDCQIIPANNTYMEEPFASFKAYMRGWDIYAPISFNHLGHRSDAYELFVKEVGDGYRRHRGARDADDITAEINFAMLFNTGQFSVNNEPDRTVEGFYETIGLLEEYQKAKSLLTTEKKD